MLPASYLLGQGRFVLIWVKQATFPVSWPTVYLYCMPKTQPFDRYHERYDAWFAHHAPAYCSELLALRALLPWDGLGLEVGVGTGRFAAPLGVAIGVDPSANMLAYAARRGVRAVRGVAEALPFGDATFDHALVVTTLCFVDDIPAMLAEAHRVLKSRGQLVIGFIDRASAPAQHYLAHPEESVFYREAAFYPASEVERLLRGVGFEPSRWVQTLSKPLEEIKDIEPLRPGTGTGAFVAVRAGKP